MSLNGQCVPSIYQCSNRLHLGPAICNSPFRKSLASSMKEIEDFEVPFFSIDQKTLLHGLKEYYLIFLIISPSCEHCRNKKIVITANILSHIFKHENHPHLHANLHHLLVQNCYNSAFLVIFITCLCNPRYR